MSILRSSSAKGKDSKKVPAEKAKSQGGVEPGSGERKPAAKSPVGDMGKAEVQPEAKKAKKKIRKEGLSQKLKIPFPYLHLSVAFVFTILFLVGIAFILGQLNSLSLKVEQSRGQLAALEEHEFNLKKLSQDLRSAQSEIAVIDQSLPDEEGIVEFVKKFKGISQNVSIEAFNFETEQPVVDETGNAYIDFTVELKGKFEDLKNFLIELVKLPYLTQLKIVDLDGADQEESKMVIRARIFVDQPFFLEKEL
jgi:Tfp pilus assembly protein PilO